MTPLRPASAIALAALVLALAGCKPKPLPERGSAAEVLYSNRCGGCHRVYPPSTMTAAMWSEQIVAMRQKIAEAGQPPMSTFDEHQILSYLQRHAGRE